MRRRTSSDSTTLPQLTHQPSYKSAQSPITPDCSYKEFSYRFVESNTVTADHDIYTTEEVKIVAPNILASAEQQEAPPPYSNTMPILKTTQIPSEALPFLAYDPYTQGDVVPLDKSRPVVGSRSGSVRSILSASSIRSIRRAFGFMKRSPSRRCSTRQKVGRKLKTDSGADDHRPPPTTYEQDACTQRTSLSKPPQKADNEEGYNVDYVCW